MNSMTTMKKRAVKKEIIYKKVSSTEIAKKNPISPMNSFKPIRILMKKTNNSLKSPLKVQPSKNNYSPSKKN